MTITESMSCPVCGGELLPHIVCSNCGTDITLQSVEGLESTYKCPVCGSDAKVKFICEECGSEFPYELIMKKMSEVEVEIKPKKKVHVEKSNLGELETGLTNGLTAKASTSRRKAKGLTNGKGKGLTNGMGKGFTNGNAKDKGLTNGIGKGLTNGLGAKEEKSVRPPKKEKNSMIPVVASIAVAIILLLGALYVLYNPPASGMKIDGNFSDWSGIPMRDEFKQPHAYSDMIKYASKLYGGGLYIYLESNGYLFSDQGSRIYAFIDADNESSTGYKINGIGADYLCKVYGNHTKVVHAAYAYNKSGTEDGLKWDWHYLQPLSLPAAYNGKQLEMALFGAKISEGYRIAFYTSNSVGNYEISSFNIGKAPSLYFEARPSHNTKDIYGFGSGEHHLMDINISASGGKININSIHMAARNLTDVYVKDSSGKTFPIDNRTSDISINLALESGEKKVYQVYQVWGRVPNSGENGTLMSIENISIHTSSWSILHKDVEPFRAYIGRPASIKIDGAFGDWVNIKNDPLDQGIPAHIDITQYAGSENSKRLYFYLGVQNGMMAGVMVPEGYYEGKPTGNASVHRINPPETGEDILLIHVTTEDNNRYTIEILGKNGDIGSYSIKGSDISSTSLDVKKDATRLEGSVSLQTFGGSQVKNISFEMSGWNHKMDSTKGMEPEHISVEQGTRSVSGPFISNIRESNQTAKAIVISWTTDVNSTGEVRYSTNSSLSTYSVKYDYRGSDYQTTLHYVKLSDLTPNKTYYYEVVSSTPDKTTTDDNGGNYYSFTTTHTLQSSTPQKSILGRVYKSDGSTPAAGAIVFVNVTTASGEQSYPLSCPVASDGYWTVFADNFINKATGDQLIIQEGDSLHIEVEGALMGTGTNDTTVDNNDPQDCGSIVLGNLPASATVSFIKSDGKQAHSYIIGDNIYVKVSDNDSSANDPSVVDIVNVTVEDPITGDKEMLKLRETGKDTGTFVNFSSPIISVNRTSGIANDGILSTVPGHYIYVSYIDKLDGDNDTTNNEKTSKALMVGYSDQSIHFVDENGTSVDEYHIGDKIYVILTSSNDTAPKISNIRESNQTAKAIVISWTTDVNSTGEVRYSTNSSLSTYSVKYDYRGSDYQTTLHYVKLSDLTPNKTYYYEVVSSTPDKTTTDDNGGNYYSFTTTHTLQSSTPQKSILGRVYKSDGSTPAAGAIVFVNVTTASGEQSYPLSCPVASDGYWTVFADNFINKATGDQLIIQEGDSLHIEVEGALMGTGTNDTTVDNNDPQDCGSIVLGAPYHVEPSVPGANRDPNVAENVTVCIKDPISGDFESVVLNETGANTSVFMNTWDIISSSINAPADNDSVIETGDGHMIEVSYYSLNDTAVMLNQSKGVVSFVDSEANEVDRYVIGDDVYLKVVDSNANLDPNSPDTIYVNVSDNSTGDWENVSLIETGNNTGVFINSVDILHSNKDAAVADNGSLETENGDTINVSYIDHNPSGYVSYDEALMVSPILDISKSANRSSVSPGDEFYYTIVVSNIGLDPALNVKIVDVLPQNLTYVNDTANADSVTHDGQRNIWTYNVLNPGKSITFRIYVKLADNAGDRNITNNATLNYTNSHDKEQPGLYATANTEVPEFGSILIPGIFVSLLVIATLRRIDNKRKRRL